MPFFIKSPGNSQPHRTYLPDRWPSVAPLACFSFCGAVLLPTLKAVSKTWVQLGRKTPRFCAQIEECSGE